MNELFTAEGQEAMFALLGSPDKRMIVYPGGHVPPQRAQLNDIIGFLADRLREPSDP